MVGPPGSRQTSREISLERRSLSGVWLGFDLAEGSEVGGRGQKLPPRLSWCKEGQVKLSI